MIDAFRAASLVAPGPPARRLRLRPLPPPAHPPHPPPPPIRLLPAPSLLPPPHLAPVHSHRGSITTAAAVTTNGTNATAAGTNGVTTFSSTATAGNEIGASTTAAQGRQRRDTRAVRHLRRDVGPGRRRQRRAAAVRAGHVPVRGRGVRVRVQRASRRRVHAVALGASPVPPPQVQRDGPPVEAAGAAADAGGRLHEPEPVRVHALHPPRRAPRQVQGVRDPRVPHLQGPRLLRLQVPGKSKSMARAIIRSTK